MSEGDEERDELFRTPLILRIRSIAMMALHLIPHLLSAQGLTSYSHYLCFFLWQLLSSLSSNCPTSFR